MVSLRPSIFCMRREAAAAFAAVGGDDAGEVAQIKRIIGCWRRCRMVHTILPISPFDRLVVLDTDDFKEGGILVEMHAFWYWHSKAPYPISWVPYMS